MALPLLPVLKLIALGSVKIVVLGVGALLAPVFTVRMVLGGTGESVRMAVHWMIEHGQLEQEEGDAFLLTLNKVQQATYTRKQALGLLFAKIKKTASGTLTSIKSMVFWVVGLFKSKK